MINLIIFILLTYGLFSVFDINFMSVSNQSLDYLMAEKKINIRDNVRTIKGKKKQNIIIMQIKKINSLLELTNKRKDLPMYFAIALVLGFIGISICIAINNMYLLPVLSIGLFLMPFIFLEGQINAYKENINGEIETTLSIITTSYLRTNDIIGSVKENIIFMNEPIKTYFIDFLKDTVKNPNIEIALLKLENKFENKIFKEWVESVKVCQSNHTLSATLTPIVRKLSDLRIINDELNMLFVVPQRDFYTIAISAVGIIPALRLINKEWYLNIFNSIGGKIALTIVTFIVFFCIYRVSNIIKLIEE